MKIIVVFSEFCYFSKGFPLYVDAFIAWFDLLLAFQGLQLLLMLGVDFDNPYIENKGASN